MKKKISLAVLLLSAAVSMSGCSYKLTKLSSKDEDKFIAYTAAVVARHNQNQKPGLTETLSDSAKKSKSDENSSENKDGALSGSDKSLNGGENNSSGSEKSGNSGGSSGNSTVDGESSGANKSSSGSGSSGSNVEKKSVGEALGYPDLDFKYTGTTVNDAFKSNNFMALKPEKGYKYLVFHYTVTNSGDKDVNLDLLSLKAVYTAKLKDRQVKNDQTILLNDMSTYQATISAGGSADLVLLFQFPENEPEDSGDYTLFVTSNGSEYQIV